MIDTTINGRDTMVYAGVRNSRIYRFFEEHAPFYKDASRWDPFLDVASSPLPWTAFKWYGPHVITVFALDQNFYDWLRIEFLGASYKPQLNHIVNGIGVFGSAAIVLAMPAPDQTNIILIGSSIFSMNAYARFSLSVRSSPSRCARAARSWAPAARSRR